MWSRANVDNRSLPRLVWQDLGAINGRCEFNSSSLDDTPGPDIIYPGTLRPQLMNYISYDHTDFPQAPNHLA